MNDFFLADITNKFSFLLFSLLVGGIPALIIITSGFFYFNLPTSKITISKDELNLKCQFYSQKFNIKDININEVKKVNEIPISYRTNGISFLGLKWGWFVVSGKKSLLLITDNKDITYIPTNKGFDIYVSLKQSDLFIKEIRKN